MVWWGARKEEVSMSMPWFDSTRGLNANGVIYKSAEKGKAKKESSFGKAFFKPFIKAFTENASQKERFVLKEKQ